MPSVSAKQARTMAAAAHDLAFAKKMGIPQTVAKEFNEADTATRKHRAARRKTTKENFYRSAWSALNG